MAKIALVTGAGHGIGKGEAIELAKAGYDVCISYCGSEEQAKDMIRHGTRGCIINTSSVHRGTNYPKASVYGPAKAAVYKLTQHMALELAPYGIRVNSVSPGYIKVTDPNVVTDREKMLVSRIPAQRTGQPEEIAAAVLYLISDAAKYVTGSDITVDGGQLLPSAVDNTYFK